MGFPTINYNIQLLVGIDNNVLIKKILWSVVL